MESRGMLVQYKTILHENNAVSVKLVGRITSCCESMRQSISLERVELETGRAGFPLVCLGMYRQSYDDSEPYEFVPINFCPFCGVKVERQEVARCCEIRTVKKQMIEQVSVTYEDVPMNEEKVDGQ
jgi:hypothetical protein